MATPRTTTEVLDRDYLEMRSRILELAAAFDRVQQAEGDPAADPRWNRLRDSVTKLLDDTPGRAEAIQRHFSLAYDSQWRESLSVVRRF